MLDPTVRAQLRWYAAAVTGSGTKECPDGKIHRADILIGEAHAGESNRPAEQVELDDPRWPHTCACGYRFEAADMRRVSVAALFRRSDTGELTTIADAPPGAMWFADWYLTVGSPFAFAGPDGRILAVKTPAGDWLIDGIASNGPRDARGWTRTGVAPSVVVRPSIAMPGMHGWLGGPDGSEPGVLVIDSP